MESAPRHISPWDAWWSEPESSGPFIAFRDRVSQDSSKRSVIFRVEFCGVTDARERRPVPHAGHPAQEGRSHDIFREIKLY